MHVQRRGETVERAGDTALCPALPCPALQPTDRALLLLMLQWSKEAVGVAQLAPAPREAAGGPAPGRLPADPAPEHGRVRRGPPRGRRRRPHPTLGGRLREGTTVTGKKLVCICSVNLTVLPPHVRERVIAVLH